jgi:uncharacterized protein
VAQPGVAVVPGLMERLRARIPDAQTLRQQRWVRWMGPVLQDPRLWHFSRRGIALGVALGVFFGLLIPVAQAPAAAALAVAMRANLPMAVVSTLVTNPITFGPVYYGAYKLGRWVLPASAESATPAITPTQGLPEAANDEKRSWSERLSAAGEFLTGVGKPLVVGLAITATVSGLLVYALISAVWALRTRLQRRRRLRQRQVPPR